MLGRIDRDPLPHNCSIEGATEYPVDLPDTRIGKAHAYVRFAGTPAPVAASRVGWHARRSIVLIAAVRPPGPVLQVRPTIAMLTASPKLRVERVQDLDIEPS